MECEEIRVDLRTTKRSENNPFELIFKFNQTMPGTQESFSLMNKIFHSIGTGSMVMAPVSGSCLDRVSIGRNVFINSNTLFMARGDITIEDDVQIAANVSLISNNHDAYDRQVLLCKPVLIKKGAWIGANATILPGICVGKHSIVGAGSVVTKDVEDYSVVAGNPAKEIKKLDPNRFED